MFVNACDRIKALKSEDKSHLLLEMGDWIYNHLSEEGEIVLIIFKFKGEQAA